MIDDRMAALEAEFDTLEADLADPAILADSDRVRDLSRRHKELGEIVRAWHELSRSRADVIVAREMLTEASGDERDMMRQEIEQAESSVAELEDTHSVTPPAQGPQRRSQCDHGDPRRGGGR